MTSWSLATFGAAAGSAVATGAMGIYLTNNYGSLLADGSVTCATPSGSVACSLGGSYGLGLQFVNIVSMVLNLIIVVLCIRRAAITGSPVGRSQSTALKAAFAVVGLSAIMALVLNGYTAYFASQFGTIVADAGMGSDCASLSTCNVLGGNMGAVFYGLSIDSVVLSSLGFLMYGYAVL